MASPDVVFMTPKQMLCAVPVAAGLIVPTIVLVVMKDLPDGATFACTGVLVLSLLIVIGFLLTRD